MSENQEIIGTSLESRSSETRLQRIQQALEGRPQVSIRLRVGLVFVILFAMMGVITISAVLLLGQVRTKITFLEKVGSVAFEVQQARRFEKNFFLYGTNLQDAMDHSHVALRQLQGAAADVAEVIGKKQFESLKRELGEYQKALERLLVAQPDQRAGLEHVLRRHGSQLVVAVENARDQERLAVHTMLQQSIFFSLVFLGVMVVALAFFAGFIIQAVLRPLGRFLKYAERIAAGDLSFIKPARKYRDEFSKLAMAFNRMLHELVQRHEQLLQSEKMAVVGKLTAGIAHELNNPLNNISLSVETLLDDFERMDRDKVRHILEQMSSQVDRASGTVRNLLDFTRKERQAFAHLDLNEIVRSTLRLVENELRLSGIEVSEHLQQDLPQVMGNPRSLEQVFLNLLLNAIQALGDGGNIEISTSSQGGRVVARISDNGPGIPAEVRRHIFEPFFTTKEPGLGTGLGLSVSKGIVEKHGGELTVESEPGRGTTFQIALPEAASEAGEEQP